MSTGDPNLQLRRTWQVDHLLLSLAGLALFAMLAATTTAQPLGAEQHEASTGRPPMRSEKNLQHEEHPSAGKMNLKKLIKQADRLKHEKKYHEALLMYEQALAILAEPDQSRNKAKLLRRIGTVYLRINQPHEALNRYLGALALYRVLGRADGEAKVLNDLGIVYATQGNYPSALDALSKALKIRRSLQDFKGIGRTLINIGIIHFDQSRYARAIESYAEGIAIIEKLADRNPSVYAKALNNLALTYTVLGRYSRAQELYRRALSIVEQTGDAATMGATLHNIGFAYAKAQNPSEALQHYKRAMEFREEIRDEVGLAATLNNMGYLRTKQLDPAGALKLFEQALALSRQNNAMGLEGRILDSMGDAYALAKDYPKALAAYCEALAIAKRRGDRRGESVTLSNIGRLWQMQGDDSLSIVFYKQAVNVNETIRKDLGGLPAELKTSYAVKVSDTYRSLADLLLKFDRVPEAQQVLDLLKIQELEDYLQDVRSSSRQSESVGHSPGEKRIADKFNDIAARFTKTLGEIIDLERRRDNLTKSQLDRFRKLVREKQRLREEFRWFMASDTVLDWKQDKSTSEKDTTLILKGHSKVQKILKKLEKTVLLYPLVLVDRLEIVLVTAYAPPVHFAVDINRIELNRIINAFRQALQNVRSDPRQLARQLYDKIIGPVRAILEFVGAETIIYAPDGALRYIPLSALYDGQKWLIEKYKIHRITAFSLSELNNEPSRDIRVLAGAFSSGSLELAVGEQKFHFSGLPFARVEVEGLAKIIRDTKTLFDQEFTPQTTVTEAGLYTIVHLATHATFLAGQPDESFILFGNGERLTLMDVKHRWAGAVLPDVELVVLSACETGIGGRLEQGEEILGFGFLMEQAGAGATIATLWTVDDGGTQVLMNNFYQYLIQGQSTKAGALQKAQLILLQGGETIGGNNRGIVVGKTENKFKGRLSHPYYWAPFILIGNGL